MKLLQVYGVVFGGILLASGVVASVNGRMEKITQERCTQCEKQEWPPEQHAEHKEFCRLYLRTSCLSM